jgi:hypothetical protein
MRQELEEKLVEKYPSLFADRTRPPTESLMCFGCECDDGWFHILDSMCSLIDHHIKNGEWQYEQPYRFTQIKEKFGGLRVYDYGHDDYIQGVIDMAEEMAAKSCEVCGDKARTKAAGAWLKTLCEKHASEMGYSEVRDMI